MGTFLDPDDFPTLTEATAVELIEDAEAQAWLAARCLFDDNKPLDDRQKAAARSILRGIVLRWNDAGTGANTQVNAGPFALTQTSQGRRGALWPSEITDLQKVCKSPSAGKAFSINTAPDGYSQHSMFCDRNFGSDTCSCGSDLNADRGPLYELEDDEP
jgi:hypothetical protein